MVDLDYDRNTFLKGIGLIFVALVLLNWIPIVNLIGFIPTFKEILLGAIVVAGLTETTDKVDGAAFAVVVGMIAAIVFNLINIPVRILFQGALSAVLSGSGDAAAAGALGGVFGGLGALSNIIGLILFSPVGYAIGGVLGTLVNE